MTQLLASQNNKPVASPLPVECPFDVEFFLVESLGFRGMAYRDAGGTWHNAQTNEQLASNVSVLE